MNESIISDACIKRLSTMAGITRLGSCSYNEIRNVMITKLQKIVGHAIVFMEHANRKTLMSNDVNQTFDLLNIEKPNHGIFFQKNLFNDSLIPLNSILKLVKEIAKEKSKLEKTPRIADETVQNLRSFIEKELLDLLKNSMKNAIHSRRSTVKSEDIKLATSYSSK